MSRDLDKKDISRDMHMYFVEGTMGNCDNGNHMEIATMFISDYSVFLKAVQLHSTFPMR